MTEAIEKVKVTSFSIPGKISPVGLELPEGLSFSDWQAVMTQLGYISSGCMWWWGDALAFGERKYGEMYSEAMKESDYDYQTLADAVWVSKSIEFSDRSENLSWTHHRQVAALDRDEQVALLKLAEEKGLSLSEFRQKIREAKRTERLGDIHADALPDATFPVIYADPPWRYEFAESESRAIENQYPTMTLEDICALPIKDLATDDAILFLWATSPKLEEALRVVTSWDFIYRSSAVWVKPQMGMGYYFRQQHELLLVATRGNMPAPAPKARVRSVFESPREKHSAKPEEFYVFIEGMYPDLPRIELFARKPRPGWSAWGNQI